MTRNGLASSLETGRNHGSGPSTTSFLTITNGTSLITNSGLTLKVPGPSVAKLNASSNPTPMAVPRVRLLAVAKAVVMAEEEAGAEAAPQRKALIRKCWRNRPRLTPLPYMILAHQSNYS